MLGGGRSDEGARPALGGRWRSLSPGEGSLQGGELAWGAAARVLCRNPHEV